MKNDNNTSHISIILLTAKAAQDNKIKGFECRADAYIIKPFDPNKLLVQVKNLIELRCRLSEKFSKEHFADSTDNIFPGNEQEFISKAIATVEAQLEKSRFTVEDLAKNLAMSRSQLHRKIKALTNQSTSQFIHTVRLHKAATLLKQSDYTISEVAYKVGFDDAGYFTRIFQKHYGKSPREFMKG
ncbi:MAG: helix-turn-helix domain-containing protein [bacterium]|nr:MAG: helix-turn-helix domain-containing protein [bacterium]